MSNTIWTPALPRHAAPIYRAIADALEKDISAGVLRDGTRLPTHRELAASLGVTPLTITRAYKEASRRGLIDSTVGRGTFVRTSESFVLQNEKFSAPRFLDLSRNVIEGSSRLEIGSRELASLGSVVRDPEYHATEGTLRHRLTSSVWLKKSGVDASADRIIITPGAQQGIVAALAAVCRPGEVVLAEELSYPRFASIASLLQVRTAGVALDEDGIIPSSLEKACRTHKPKALYLIPNFQNPTGSVMPEKRRREIAAVAKRHSLVLLEDDVYGFLLEENVTPFISLLPEQTCYLTGLSKSLTPSLRIGIAAVPASLFEATTAALSAMTAFTSSFAAEAFTLLMENGSADETVRAKRRMVQQNRKAADRALDTVTVRGHESSPHLWIELPKTCDSRDLADRARLRGIGISPAVAFAIDRSVKSPNAVRVSIAAVEKTRHLESALRTLASLITDSRLSSTTVV